MRQCYALILMVGLIACSPNTPTVQPTSTPSGTPSASVSPVTPPQVSFTTAQAIIRQRCVSCHAQMPTRPGFREPAGGVTFESPEQIQAKADRILVRAVQTKSMPQGNVTGMTEAERQSLKNWIEQGAKLQ